MYILIDKETKSKAQVIKEKTVLSDIIGYSTRTILRKQNLLLWETKEYVVYNPIKVLVKSTRGGKRR